MSVIWLIAGSGLILFAFYNIIVPLYKSKSGKRVHIGDYKIIYSFLSENDTGEKLFLIRDSDGHEHIVHFNEKNEPILERTVK